MRRRDDDRSHHLPAARFAPIGFALMGATSPFGASSVRLSLEVAGGPDAATESRRALARLEHKLGRQLFEDVALLVSELVTNSVRHAGSGPEQQLHIDAWADPRGVRVEVADRGPGFDAGAATVATADEPRSGWGLFLVGRIADRWGVLSNDETRVWFEIDRRSGGSLRQPSTHQRLRAPARRRGHPPCRDARRAG